VLEDLAPQGFFATVFLGFAASFAFFTASINYSPRPPLQTANAKNT
jgi:hypothetical protein